MHLPTAREIEAAKTPRGGWTRAQLAEWGVPWPRVGKPRCWRKATSRIHLRKERAAMQDDIHLLDNYGTAATKTLCGVAVPQLLGSARGTLRWAHVGRETCRECQKVHQSRVGQLAGTPSPPTKKAHPLFQVVKKGGGSPP